MKKKTNLEEFVRLFFSPQRCRPPGIWFSFNVYFKHLERALKKELTLNTVKVTSSGLTRSMCPSLCLRFLFIGSFLVAFVVAPFLIRNELEAQNCVVRVWLGG